MIWAWIVAGILALCIMGVAGWIMVEASSTAKIIAGAVGTLLVAACFIGASAYLHNTESGQRAVKTWQSETSGGIERTVTVYDINGSPIKSYTGRFDVDYDGNRIIFDDENDKRHIIYYPTGTVIVDEN